MNLIYVADPMCSWCYGFAVSLDALLAEPGAAAPLQLAIVMGGLRPFTQEPLEPARADEIAGHWRHVAASTGQLSLANGGDSVILKDGGGVVKNSYSYGSALSGTDGVSMNRSPDASTGGFVLHTTLSSLGSSAGKRVNGTAF